jgi:hypothetical protein
LDLPDASALVAKPKEPAEGPDVAEQPAAQRPQAPQPKAPSIQRRPPTRRLQPGDLVCPECGEGNDATRKFCSRCGTSLQAAEIVKRKWWQRLLPRSGPKKRKAGDRPSARKTRTPLPMKMLGVMAGGTMRIVGIAVLIGGIVYGLFPSVRNTINHDIGSVKNKINSWIHPTRTEVLPNSVLVSSRIGPRHSFPELKDTATNTYWAARIPKSNTEHITLTFGFSDKFDLKNIVVWNGVGDAKSPDYNSTARPDHVFLTFPDSSVPGCAIEFGDNPAAPSKVDVSKCHANGIEAVQVRIDDYYGQSKATHLVALAKIQFFKG